MINVWARPAIADLDRDGEKEIVVAGSTELYVYRRDGTILQVGPSLFHVFENVHLRSGGWRYRWG